MHVFRKQGRGFTLIELLIVVAIIAILALIAVPNFLEAQTRAKVVRVKTDFRLLLVGMEAYNVDWNDYPPDMTGGAMAGSSWFADYRPLCRLTTPVSYISYVPTNPFFDIEQSESGGPSGETGRGNYAFWGYDRHPWIYDGHGIFWHIISCGPDLNNDLGGQNQLSPEFVINRYPQFINAIYDPTNGTVSSGDLHLCNKGITNP